MRHTIKRALESEAAALICVLVFLAFCHQVLPKIDPEIQAPTQGILADVWRTLRDSGQRSLDLSDLMKERVPSDLFLGFAAGWVRSEVIGMGRGRVRNADLHCPSAFGLPHTVQCDLRIGRDPCLYRVRMVFESRTEHEGGMKLTATAERCRADG